MQTEKLSSQHESLFVKLTEDELREKGGRLAEVFGKLEDIDAQEATFKAELKAQREPLNEEMAFLARAVRYKQELRSVEVDNVADYDVGVLRAVRTDTGEVIRERALRLEERQGKMFAFGEKVDPNELIPPIKAKRGKKDAAAP